jgi:hypothetical protein
MTEATVYAVRDENSGRFYSGDQKWGSLQEALTCSTTGRANQLLSRVENETEITEEYREPKIQSLKLATDV